MFERWFKISQELNKIRIAKERIYFFLWKKETIKRLSNKYRITKYYIDKTIRDKKKAINKFKEFYYTKKYNKYLILKAKEYYRKNNLSESIQFWNRISKSHREIILEYKLASNVYFYIFSIIKEEYYYYVLIVGIILLENII